MTALAANSRIDNPRRGARRRRRVLPGFGLSLGYTLMYLSLIVLIPLGALVLKTATLTWDQFWGTVWRDPLVFASYKLSFGASIFATAINAVMGLIVAWVLVRYPFPGRRFFDALIDLPFALPTAVAGITFSNLYSPHGWLGGTAFGGWVVNSLGWALNSIGVGGDDRSVGGVVLVLVFVGLPFIVRSVQPVLQDMDKDIEEAASSLGASRWYTFRRVIFPALLPAWLSGLGLAFARSVGEYGSVIFIASGIPGRTEIAPLQIITKLADFRYAQATAIAVVLLSVSLLVLLMINGIEWWSRRHERE
jgi:sulfate/thiosulfate transport system permease protein